MHLCMYACIHALTNPSTPPIHHPSKGLRSIDAMALHRELEGEPMALLPLVLPRKEQIQPGYVGIDGRRREK